MRGWTQLTGLCLFALGARVLGVSDFGVFALAVAFINVVQIFLYSGIYEFVMKSRAEEGLDHTALMLNLGVSCLGALGSATLGYLIGLGSHQPAVFPLTLAMAPSALIVGVAAWHEAQVLRRNRYGLYYVNWAVTEAIAAASGAALLLLHTRLYSLVGYRYLQSVLTLLGYLIFCPVPYWGAFRRNQIRTIVRFAAPIYGSRLLSALSNYGVDMVVGVLIGPAATGLYRMSSRIVSSIGEALYQPLRVLSWVRASKARASERRIALTLLPLNRVATLILWPLAVIVGFIAGDLLRLGLGPKWMAATPIIATLLLSRCIGVAEVFLEPLLAITGAGERLLIIRIVSIAAMFAALIGFSRLGPTWIGGANLVASIVILAAVAPRLIRIAGLSRVVGSAREGALAALLIGAIFLLSDAAINWCGVGVLTAHGLATALSGALLAGFILRDLPAFLTLKR